MADTYKIAFFGLIVLMLLGGIWYITTQNTGAANNSGNIASANNPSASNLFGYGSNPEDQINTQIGVVNNDGLQILLDVNKVQKLSGKYDMSNPNTYASECKAYYSEYKGIMSNSQSDRQKYFRDLNNLAVLMNENTNCLNNLDSIDTAYTKYLGEASALSDQFLQRWCDNPSVVQSEFQTDYGISLLDWVQKGQDLDTSFNDTLTNDCPSVNVRLGGQTTG